ncbi:MAG: hypothetical protein A4E19_05090 [Nitrospira sp. SG-bin1]|nr:MAG: hypothetical protein A4E19_05090 [Nitrospira sp. SG-bin1]
MQAELFRSTTKAVRTSIRRENTSWKSSFVPQVASSKKWFLSVQTWIWNQVFCELNRLSRGGQVRLTMKSTGLYAGPNPTSCNHPA